MPVETTLVALVTVALPIAGALFASAMTVKVALATVREKHTAQADKLEDHIKNEDAHITRDYMTEMDKRFIESEKQSRQHTEHEINKVLAAIGELRADMNRRGG